MSDVHTPTMEEFLPSVPRGPRTQPQSATRRRNPRQRRRTSARIAPPQNETPRQRFLRIAGHRMASLLREIRLVGNCAAPGYEYRPEDVDRMRAVVHNAVEDAFDRYSKSGTSERLEDTFKIAD